LILSGSGCSLNDCCHQGAFFQFLKPAKCDRENAQSAPLPQIVSQSQIAESPTPLQLSSASGQQISADGRWILRPVRASVQAGGGWSSRNVAQGKKSAAQPHAPVIVNTEHANLIDEMTQSPQSIFTPAIKPHLLSPVYLDVPIAECTMLIIQSDPLSSISAESKREILHFESPEVRPSAIPPRAFVQRYAALMPANIGSLLEPLQTIADPKISEAQPHFLAPQLRPRFLVPQVAEP